MSYKNSMRALIEQAVMDKKMLNFSPQCVQALVNIVLEDTMFAISSVPNPKWSDAPNGKARMVMIPAIKLPDRDIDDVCRHPGQPDSGSRWFAPTTVRYTYPFKGEEIKSLYPGIKVTNCYINLNSRPRTKEIDTYGTDYAEIGIPPKKEIDSYGKYYVEIGIPFKTAENLTMALNIDSGHNCIIGGSMTCDEDGCEWINCSLKRVLEEGPKPRHLEMIIDECDHHVLNSRKVTIATIKKKFNKRHKSCRNVINNPKVEDYYLCDLVLEPYGSTVLPDGATPTNTEEFKTEMKFYIRMVYLLSNGHHLVGSKSRESVISVAEPL